MENRPLVSHHEPMGDTASICQFVQRCARNFLMKIGLEEVRRVAALARLALTPAEEELLTVQLDSILQFVEKLNEVDTSAVEPLAHVVAVGNALREDRIGNQPATDLLLANAPAREKDFFKVPKIIE